MNKEIKIIDLLKDYADGKEIPRKIRIGDEIYTRTGNSEIYYMYNNYYNETNHYWMGEWSISVSCETGIIDTVEIIEEEKEIPEKLTPFEAPFLKNDEPDIRFRLIIDSINKICDYLKNKGE